MSQQMKTDKGKRGTEGKRQIYRRFGRGAKMRLICEHYMKTDQALDYWDICTAYVSITYTHR